MTDKRTPSRPPDSDALLDRYRESARLDDTTRPAPNVRAAILEQAAAQARLRDEGEAPRVVDDSPRPAANEGRWRLKAFASVMLMGLAGLLAWQVERAPEGELLRDSTSRPAVAPDPAAGTPGRGECGERRTGDTLGRSVPGRDCGGAHGDTRGAASGRGRTRAAPGCGHAAAGRERVRAGVQAPAAAHAGPRGCASIEPAARRGRARRAAYCRCTQARGRRRAGPVPQRGLSGCPGRERVREVLGATRCGTLCRARRPFAAGPGRRRARCPRRARPHGAGGRHPGGRCPISAQAARGRRRPPAARRPGHHTA